MVVRMISGHMPTYYDPGDSRHRAATCCARRSSPGILWQRGTDGCSLPCQIFSGGLVPPGSPHSPLFIDRICGTAAYLIGGLATVRLEEMKGPVRG